MFLTGQRAQFPWDMQTNKKALFKKDHNYYKTKQNQNLWDNEFRSPKKLSKNIIEDRERY